MVSTPIPTNIITGFLGVGKTTALLHLLANKTNQEPWAILVNEFGEVGLDGAILSASGAWVKEVAGGCLCCTAGVPLQVALTGLIRKAKPARLLIEPTGLGHPQQIEQQLSAPPFNDWLQLQACIALVDPRKLLQERYLQHPTFQAQLALADVLVANKADLASPEALAAFQHFSQACQPPKSHVAVVTQAALNPNWLSLPRKIQTPSKPAPTRNALAPPLMALPPLADRAGEWAEKGFYRKENTGLGHFSCGWVFAADVVFAMDKLFIWLSGLPCLRLKAVMRTADAVVVFNAEQGVLSVKELPDACDSRLEIIQDTPCDWLAVEATLLGCVLQGLPHA